LEKSVKKVALKKYIVAAIFGLICVPFVWSSAYADEKIRLISMDDSGFDPYSGYGSETIIAQELADDFNQFLNIDNDVNAEHYIVLTEPSKEKKPLLSLDNDDQLNTSSLKVNIDYLDNSSFLFELPSSAYSLNPLAGYPAIIQPGLLNSTRHGSQMIISFSSSSSLQSELDKSKSLNLILGSNYEVTSLSTSLSSNLNNLIPQKSYNVSFGLGYSGFQIGASMSRNSSLLSRNLTGYDFGMGYEWESWSANLRFGEYKRGRSFIIQPDNNLFDKYSAFEIGAAYSIFPNLNLTGRFTYYSHGLSKDLEPVDDIKTLIFGTNLSF
jgi:hypothetical protein